MNAQAPSRVIAPNATAATTPTTASVVAARVPTPFPTGADTWSASTGASSLAVGEVPPSALDVAASEASASSLEMDASAGVEESALSTTVVPAPCYPPVLA